jgi:prepilin-type N-terminal cleavage/methylation domain-containing protein
MPVRSHKANRGFTLVELLVVIVIIGILAAISIQSYSNSKEQSLISVMKGDLRNLATSQEAYYYDNQTYYGGPIPDPALLFSPSPGVTITLQNVSSQGWAATATHIGTSRTCAIYVGNGGPIGPASVEGEAACTN